MAEMSAPKIQYTVDKAVAQVTLNRPDAMNTYDVELVAALTETVAQIRNDNAVRAVVLTGAGDAFCAGADISMISDNVGGEAVSPVAAAFVKDLHAALLAVYQLPMPVICAVNGACAGGGVGLALAADITWASEAATFTTAFTAIGLSPDTGTSALLPRAVGARVARELLLTNRRVSASEALALGLVTRVLDKDELLPACVKLAQKLARGPTATFARTKALLDASATGALDTQLDLERASVMTCLTSADLKEGVTAFLQRRRPEFKDR